MPCRKAMTRVMMPLVDKTKDKVLSNLATEGGLY